MSACSVFCRVFDGCLQQNELSREFDGHWRIL